MNAHDFARQYIQDHSIVDATVDNLAEAFEHIYRTGGVKAMQMHMDIRIGATYSMPDFDVEYPVARPWQEK